MVIVVDSSALVSSLVDLEDGKWVRGYTSGGATINCPSIIQVECASSLRRLERIGAVSSAMAAFALNHMLRLDVRLFPFAPFAARIWELRHNLTSYDAWYVALAESLGCPLVTLDRRISRAGGVRCEVVTPPITTQG